MRLSKGQAVVSVLAATSIVIVATLSTQDAAANSEVKATDKLSFGRDILPILSDKCFKCHGPDASSRAANLRLDEAKSAFAQRHGEWAIVPGKPESSLLTKKISDADDPMPPANSGKSLSPDEKAKLNQWIREGALYGKQWALEALPRSVAVPQINSTWPKNDIDRFVLARLQKEGLKPSAPASKERWLRRVTLDITGLLPSEDDIESFNKDTNPGSFDKVVDRLLASPKFGERVASDWLDAARYSDSYGYQSDLLMPAWPYRDWVVRAFNSNLPYDQFITDQIAGDLLPGATTDQRLATAFNRLHRQSNEGGSIPEDFKTEYVVDRVSTFGTAVLGMTVGCARCHDHKFDPISQKEFYQLFSYFNSIDEFGLLLSSEIVPTPSLLLPTPDQEKRLAEAKAQVREAVANVRKAKGSAKSRYAEWLKHSQVPIGYPWMAAHITFDKEDKGAFVNTVAGGPNATRIGSPKLIDGPVGKGLEFDGENGLNIPGLPAKERFEPFSWSFYLKDPREQGQRVVLHRTGGTDVGFCGLDLLIEDGRLIARVMRHWPGNAIAIETKQQVPKSQWTHVTWTWDGSGDVSGLKLYLNGKPADCTVLADKIWKNIHAYGDLGASGGNWSFAQRFRDLGFKGGAIADVRMYPRAISDGEVASFHVTRPVKAEELGVDWYCSCFDAEYKTAAEHLQQAQKVLMEAELPVQEVEVMEQSRHEIPSYLLARGRYDAPKNAQTLVHPGVPASMPPLPRGAPNNRLGLAKWATSPDHPLTARVAVNRFWQLMFGTGLVDTQENFGMQGSLPSHPELLDYLARRFVNNHWDVKKLIKEIVLSATYRQDSARKPRDSDPQNRLYARGPSGRLTAEEMRDASLFAAGKLDTRLGGPPVNPYQPSGIWTENNTMSPGFVQSKGDDLFRRSLYSTWKRTTPIPSSLIFDANARESCAVRRPTTDTPLQALVLLNDVQFVETSRLLAESVLKIPGSETEAISHLFMRLAGRRPDDREMEILGKTLAEQKQTFQQQPGLVSKIISLGDHKADPQLDPTELAAMTVTVQTILNSDAFSWKR